jgi:putative Mg2+ transporter-C (MgtC) family protein
MLSNLELVGRLTIAALLGSVIGFERERLLWAAGLRTHMLVCVGACLVMIVSAYGFTPVLRQNVVLDPSRVAAQVVSGVGFIGAGSIILRNEVVKGLTTAASLWAVAAIGLAVGGGLYVAAAAATAIILVILAGIKPIEERFRARRGSVEIRLQSARGTITMPVLTKLLGWRADCVRGLAVRSSEDPGMDDVSITLARLAARDVATLMNDLRALPGVSSVEDAGRPAGAPENTAQP